MLVGDPYTFANAIHNNGIRERNTLLKNKLLENINSI